MAAAPSTISFMQPTDPASYAAQIQLQRRQQIADALLQQSQTPMSADLPQNLRVVPKLGWQGGLVKLGQALLANKLEDNVAQQRGALAQQQMAGLAQQFGGGSGQGGAQPSPPQSPYAGAQQAMAQPGQGQPGPTMAAAAQIPQQPQGMPPQQPQQAPQASQGGPMNIPGMDPNVSMRMFMTNPDEYWKAMAAARAPTTEQKNWTAQGVDPRALAGGTTMAGQRAGMTDLEKLQDARSRVPAGSPQAAQLDDAISKANYVAPIDAKPGTPVLDPRTLQPRFFAPKVADGVGLAFGSDPMHPTAYALPGYADANASIVAADQRAKTDNSVFSATGPGGEPLTVRGSAIPGGGGAPPAPGGPGVAPAPGQAAVPGAPAPRLPGLAGPGITDKESMKSGAAVIDQAPQQVAGSKQAITGLSQALNLVESGLKTGPGTEGSVKMLALVNNAGIPLLKGDVDGYKSMQKYLQNSLNAAAAGTSAGGSDARFESFMHGQPNAETMTPVALSSAIRYVLSQHDATVARGNFIGHAYQEAKAQGDSNPALTAQQQWASVYNPDYFRVGRLAPAEQLKAVNAMSPNDAQHFMAWRKAMGVYQQ